MVIAGSGKEDRERKSERELMAMGLERSKPPLHNFSMGCLRWGTQRFLRCAKVNPEGGAIVDRRSSPPLRRRDDGGEKRGSFDSFGVFQRAHSPAAEAAAGIGGLKRGRAEIGGDDGIEAMRAKLMLDFQTAVDKVKVSLMQEAEAEAEEQAPAPASAPEEDTGVATAAAARPWNLRTRRAACKAPNGGDGGGGGKALRIEERRVGSSPLRTENRSLRCGGGASPEKKERRKLTVGLSRREIEEDYYSIFGERPPRRPKKRPKNVQKYLDTLFPGLWLTEITADTYKVPDLIESGKR